MRALQWNCVGVYSLVGSVSCHCFKLQRLQPGLQSENCIGLHANLLDLLIQCSKDRHKVNVTNIPAVRQLLISISVYGAFTVQSVLPACLLGHSVSRWFCSDLSVRRGHEINLTVSCSEGIGPIQCSQSHVVMLRKRVEVPLRLMMAGQ